MNQRSWVWAWAGWLGGCGASAHVQEIPPSAPGPAAPGTSVDGPAGPLDALAIAPETVVPAVSHGDPRDLAWTGRGSVMVKVEGRGPISTFFLDRTEVSELAYRICSANRCRGAGGPGSSSGEPRKAVLLELEDAKKYCAWAGKRLPTFAELELAAGPDLQKNAAESPGGSTTARPTGAEFWGSTTT
jgi:hypothetical protein